MTNIFFQFNYVELLALQRVFREAKFNQLPDDDEISTSPIVAAMFVQIVDALSHKAVERFGESERENWDKWLLISDDRDEWRNALARVKSHSRWRVYSLNEKEEYVANLLAPFKMSVEVKAAFFEQCEHLHR
jgi:hypothetical protein